MLFAHVGIGFASTLCCGPGSDAAVQTSKSSPTPNHALNFQCPCDAASSNSKATPPTVVPFCSLNLVDVEMLLSESNSTPGPILSHASELSSVVSGIPLDHLFLQHCSFLT
jgi:hypothetical protein